MKVTIGPGGLSIFGGYEYVGIWIDYDHSGTFDVNEFTDLGFTQDGPVSGNILIPASALSGDTRMRVRVAWDPSFPALTASDACSDLFNGFGETEDYAVTIAPCVQGAVTVQPANTSIACGSDASFTVAASGSLINYQWEQRVNAATPWTSITDGGIYSGSTTSTLSLTGVTDANNGYQYRALISGACTATDFSNIALLTVTPLIATVSPTPANVCSGSILPLSITNTSSAPVTSTFSSGAISVLVPDANLAGANNTIAVSGIPPGAIINSISVKITLPHTFVGDLDMVLKAPNGSILNLDYFLTATGGPGATSGFLNTVISSSGTAELQSGTDPWTGIFAPDGIVDLPGPGFPQRARQVSILPYQHLTDFILCQTEAGPWRYMTDSPVTKVL